MPVPGPELKKAREAREMTLEQIAARTHIAKKYLKALEDGDYKVFPGQVYLRGALRKYASEVGIEPEQAISWYENGISLAEPASAAPDQERLREIRVPGKRVNIWPFLFILAAALVLFLAGRHAYRVILPKFMPPPGQEAVLPALPPEPGPNGEAEEPVPPKPVPPPVTVEREVVSDGLRFVVRGTAELSVSLTFTGRCWISLAVDGITVREGTFSSGEGFNISAGQSIRLRAGYPPALEITAAGKKLELLNTGNPYNVEIILGD